VNVQDNYRFTKRDIEQASDILRRYWMNDRVSPPTMDEVDFAELAEVAEQMADRSGTLPTVAEVHAKLARDVEAHHLRHYESARKDGGLYDYKHRQIYWFPERLDPERRQRLQREQAAALCR